jgi:acyl dehydratase
MTAREISAPPRMLPLFARAGVALIPGASRLPFIGGWGGGIPDLELVLGHVTVDPERLAAYNRVCGFSPRDTLPPTYPHVFAFPLALALMTDPGFPFPAIGLVHIANQITQHRPIGVNEQLTFKVWATPVEPHSRGKQFSVRCDVRVGDELVWEESSTNLRRGGGSGNGSGDGSGSASDPKTPSAEQLPATATWNLPGDLGRRYASVSGDMNPIHMHPLSARLFGFPSAIAHGMWTKARCLAALEPGLPEKFAVEVAFRRPILLPATVQFAEQAENGRVQFGVRDASKATPHLDGQLSSM